MKTIIVGFGEVGKALSQLLDDFYDVEIIETKEDIIESSNIYVLHITFPYSKEFEQEVSKYQRLYNPCFTVIHSTVPVGTSRKLNALHSPIRGKHPHLYESLTAFEKIIGGENSDEIADYFRYTGIKVSLVRKSETSELAKLLDTLYYGVCIEFAKEVEKLCEEYDVPFSEVYTLPNKTYNEGYMNLGYSEYVRPVLQPLQKKIGGHCVLENTELLSSKFSKFISELNKGRSNKN